MNVPFGEIELNDIHVKRKGLTFIEAVYVWLMRWSGETQQDIAAQFGTNSGRIADILNEKTHEGSKAKAFELRAG